MSKPVNQRGFSNLSKTSIAGQTNVQKQPPPLVHLFQTFLCFQSKTIVRHKFLLAKTRRVAFAFLVFCLSVFAAPQDTCQAATLYHYSLNPRVLSVLQSSNINLKISLYSRRSATNLIGKPWITNSVPITNGIISLPLDFGVELDPEIDRWLEFQILDSSGNAVTNGVRRAVFPTADNELREHHWTNVSHLLKHHGIETFTWLYFLCAGVIAFCPRLKWKSLAKVFWFACWLSILPTLFYAAFFIGVVGQRGVAVEYGDLWVGYLTRETFLFALFAGVIRFLSDTTIDFFKDGTRVRSWRLLEWFTADAWLLWLIVAAFIECKYSPESYERLTTWNSNWSAVPLTFLFLFTGCLWVFTCVYYRFVKQEHFAPNIIRPYICSWLRKPIQVLLMGPPLSGKSNVFSACTGREHVHGNIFVQKDTYKATVPPGVAGRAKSLDIVISMIDPPGEELGIHLHYAKSLRTDNLVTCFNLGQFNRTVINTPGLITLTSLSDALLNVTTPQDYLKALTFSIRGQPDKFGIKQLTVFIDTENKNQAPQVVSATEVQGLTDFTRFLAATLAIQPVCTRLFIGQAAVAASYYSFNSMWAPQQGAPVFLRTLIPAITD
jgi:hypothetical protein